MDALELLSNQSRGHPRCVGRNSEVGKEEDVRAETGLEHEPEPQLLLIEDEIYHDAQIPPLERGSPSAGLCLGFTN